MFEMIMETIGINEALINHIFIENSDRETNVLDKDHIYLWKISAQILDTLETE